MTPETMKKQDTKNTTQKQTPSHSSDQEQSENENFEEKREQ